MGLNHCKPQWPEKMIKCGVRLSLKNRQELGGEYPFLGDRQGQGDNGLEPEGDEGRGGDGREREGRGGEERRWKALTRL